MDETGLSEKRPPLAPEAHEALYGSAKRALEGGSPIGQLRGIDPLNLTSNDPEIAAIITMGNLLHGFHLLERVRILRYLEQRYGA